jgi:hypothetical protein
MAHTLIITARPGGGLSYTDDDVVQVLDGHQFPGNSVVGTESGFSFVYCSDKDHDDPEVLALMEPWEGDLIDPDDPDAGREQLGKRRYQVTLTGSEFDTWVAHDDAAAAAITKTWAEILALRTDKAGA